MKEETTIPTKSEKLLKKINDETTTPKDVEGGGGGGVDVDLDEIMSENDDHSSSTDNGWNIKGLVFCGLSFILADTNIGMIVPFLPLAAKARGLNSSTVGFIFSMFNLTNFCTCFFVPKVNMMFGGIKVLTFCNLAMAATTACMAFTGMIHNSTTYLITMLFLRGLQGALAAGAEISAAGLIFRSAPRTKVAEAMAMVEAIRIVGIVVGPVMGGGMYQRIGYPAPFLLMAALVGALSAAMIFFPIHHKIDNKNERRDDSHQKQLMKSPVIQISVAFAALFATAVSFLEPSLEPFMAKAPYNLSNLQVGLVYSSLSLTFALAAGCSQALGDVLGLPTIMILSAAINGIAYNIIAPAKKLTGPLSLFYFLHQNTKGGAIALSVGAIALIGVGGGMGIVPGTELMFKEGEYLGHSKETVSDSIAMIMYIPFTVGFFLGPLIGGSLVHSMGFPRSCALFGICVFVVSVILTLILSCILRRRKTDESNNNNDSTNPTTTDSTSSSDDLSRPLLSPVKEEPSIPYTVV